MPKYSDSGYNDADSLTGDEYLLMVQDGETVRVTAAQIAALAGDFTALTGTATGQIPVWNDDTETWVAVSPNDVTAGDIEASSTGFANSDGDTVQGILDDLDDAITGGGGGGGGGGGVSITDDFNRADSASSLGSASGSHAWSALSGTWGINGNKAYKPSAGGVVNFATIDAAVADCTVTCTVIAGAGSSYRGVTLRATDASNLLFVQLDNSGDTVSLAKRIGGTNTGLASAAQSINGGSNYTIEAVMVGTNITIKVNGVTKITYNTTTGQEAATKHGLYAIDTMTTGGFEDFSVVS